MNLWDHISGWYGGLNRFLQSVLAGVLLLGVAWIDYATGAELAFSIFYLAPICLISWFSGRYLGIVFACLGATLWFAAEVGNHRVYEDPVIGYWNSAVRLGFFLIVNHLVSRIRKELHHVRELSQRDFLTGAFNRRHFSEIAESELERLSRYGRPLSLAYIDLDNFKTVNDTLGHEVGDGLLKSVVKLFQETLRKPDVVARIGGDEFLILMPETGAEGVRPVIQRILERTRDSMAKQKLPVALSIGVVTCARPSDLNELIRTADAQMYLSKQAGKDTAHFDLLTSDAVD